MKIGTAISKVATPIAGVLGLDCYDPFTRDLRPESPCARSRQALDEGRWIEGFVVTTFERFWSRKDQSTTEGKTMREYGVQCIVEAENLAELEQKLKGVKQIVAVQVRQPPLPATHGVTGQPISVIPGSTSVIPGSTSLIAEMKRGQMDAGSG